MFGSSELIVEIPEIHLFTSKLCVSAGHEDASLMSVVFGEIPCSDLSRRCEYRMNIATAVVNRIDSIWGNLGRFVVLQNRFAVLENSERVFCFFNG